jgi:hypothetical protein
MTFYFTKQTTIEKLAKDLAKKYDPVIASHDEALLILLASGIGENNSQLQLKLVPNSRSRQFIQPAAFVIGEQAADGPAPGKYLKNEKTISETTMYGQQEKDQVSRKRGRPRKTLVK